MTLRNQGVDDNESNLICRLSNVVEIFVSSLFPDSVTGSKK